MAIVLQPKTDYKLLSESHSNQDKLIVHVKLTDSCLKALQEYQSSKGSTQAKPSIRFTGQDGTISIPIKKSSTGDARQFQFGCSTLQSLGHGCLDCLHQPGRGTTLQSLGSITHKINICATDDSYTMTRDRMKEAEEERKEIRSKLIKTPNKGGKKRPPNKRTNLIMNMKRSMQNQPKLSNGASKSLRERVLHLLAIRPYKKPELILRLRKDGVILKDKNTLTNLLQQVATISNNQYTLMKHIYAEVQDTWPCYTDEERKVVQRKLKPTEGESSSQPSSAKTSPSKKQEPPALGNKRQSSSISYASPANKKQRIAHVVNTNNNVSKENPEAHSVNNTKRHYDTSPSTKEQVKDENKAVNFRDKKPVSSTKNGEGKTAEMDYKKQYRPIETYEQRLLYKRDFQVEYEEYLHLKNKIDNVTKKFMELKGSLTRCPENSEERQNIEKQIVRSYKKHTQDPSWERCKKRCQALHTKLTYIKELIRDFDDKRTKETAT
ncbi:RNA polymerase II elongation factor ELL2 isoform X1 [Nematostella vectensis]|uniref:RNA polymerase II elongation factor ELL2 isoform X1 n=1 Tax=Nematostella vectensis TaxID=45351 RepID=UPI0020774518|nr:RNA polymerase II elongation factor ELL2 isoform X1 [Nematostella vectensis]